MLSIRGAVGTALYGLIVFRLGFFVERYGQSFALQLLSASFATAFIALWWKHEMGRGAKEVNSVVSLDAEVQLENAIEAEALDRLAKAS